MVDKNSIINLLDKGLTQSQIARKLNCSSEYVRQVKVRYGYDYKKPSVRKSEDIKKDYIEGYTQKQISERCQISTSVISRMLTADGLTEQKRINRHNKIKECYDLGMSDPKIAETVRCCNEVVFRWRKANDLPANYPANNVANFNGRFQIGHKINQRYNTEGE